MSGRVVNGISGMVAYLKPSHARPDKSPVMVRRLAYPKGVVPPQLRPYVEAVKELKNKGKEVK